MSLADRVSKRLQAMGLSRAEASRQIGCAETFLRDLITGRKRSITESNARRLAPVLGTTVEWLLEGRGPEVVDNDNYQLAKVAVTIVPMVGYVEVGAWREGAASMGAKAKSLIEPLKVAPPPGYDGEALFAVQLRDGSMNKHYGPDAFLIVCPIEVTDARIGDHVIVVRTRDTVSEIICAELGADTLLFHSTLPEMPISRPFKPDDGQRIIGVVIGDQRMRNRPLRHSHKG